MPAVVDHVPCAKIMQLVQSLLVLRRKHSLKSFYKVGEMFPNQYWILHDIFQKDSIASYVEL